MLQRLSDSGQPCYPYWSITFSPGHFWYHSLLTHLARQRARIPVLWPRHPSQKIFWVSQTLVLVSPRYGYCCQLKSEPVVGSWLSISIFIHLCHSGFHVNKQMNFKTFKAKHIHTSIHTNQTCGRCRTIYLFIYFCSECGLHKGLCDHEKEN